MKSESATFKNIQFPFTLIGVPPKLMMLVFLAGIFIFVVFFLIDLIEYSLPVTVIFLAVSWLKLFKLRQKNPHLDNYIFKAPRFWRAKSEVTLVTGQPPLIRKRGKR